jgi:hypothetical protein
VSKAAFTPDQLHKLNGYACGTLHYRNCREGGWP